MKQSGESAYPLLFILIPLLLFSLANCRLLDMNEPEEDIPDPLNTTLKPGESRKFELSNSQADPLLLTLSGIASPGIYSLTFSSSTNRYELDNISLKISPQESFQDDYLLVSWFESSGGGEARRYELFESGDTKDKYAKAYVKYTDRDATLFTISFTFHTVPLTDPFPDYYSNRQLWPDSPLNGIFSRLMDRPEDYFILKGINVDQNYKLSIDFDYTKSVLPLDDDLIPKAYLYNKSAYSIVKADYEAHGRRVLFFSVSNTDATRMNILGYTGISYTLQLAPVPERFAPDPREPDDGPVSGGLESVIDSGEPAIRSESHTLTRDDADWIQFTPLKDTDYQIYAVLEDAWYDVETKDGFSAYLYLELIKPDGATWEKGTTCNFNQIPDSGTVTSTTYLGWSNTDGSGDPWFIKVTAGYPEGMKYSLSFQKE